MCLTGVDYFSTKERTKAVNDWMAKNRPDLKIKQVDFTDPSKVGPALKRAMVEVKNGRPALVDVVCQGR